MPDRHIRRDADAYWHALVHHLPQGIAWPREPDTVIMQVMRGLAGILAYFDERTADLLERESDPRLTLELLPEWERAWGLPDPCLETPQTIEARHKALVTKMTLLGAQSRAFFIDMAARLGYTITIQEYAPWMFGVSEVGLTDDLEGAGYPRWEIAAPEIRFYWTVAVSNVDYIWWRYGQAEIGVDPHLLIAIPDDLECIFDRYKPAHTDIIYDFHAVGWHNMMPATYAMVLTSFHPMVDLPFLITGAGLQLTTDAPTLLMEDKFFKWPDTATLVLTTSVPGTLSSIAPATDTLIITGYVPDRQLQRYFSPSVEGLVLTAYAPAVAREKIITVPQDTLTVTGYAPVVELPSLVLVSDNTSHLLLQTGGRLSLI